MEKYELKQLARAVTQDVCAHDERYNNFKRLWVEITNNEEAFLDYLADDIENSTLISRKIVYALTNEDGTYKYPPQLLAQEISSHTERMASISRFVALQTVVLSIFLVVALPEWYKVAVVLFVAGVLGPIQWNLERNISNRRRLIIFLEGLPANDASCL